MPDGRTLSYAEYGDTSGPPLLWFHGTPGSRLEHDPLDRALPARIILPERPGYGRSDPQHDRSLAGWANDVASLADALGLDRFAVVGVSGGGPHALACAAVIPDRLNGVGVICGVGPLADPAAGEGMNPMNQALFEVARTDRAQFTVMADAMVEAITSDPDGFFEQSLTVLPPVDQAAMVDPRVRALYRDSMTEAMRQGSVGMVEETVMLASPWDIEVRDILVDVLMWQGTEDTNVPLRHAELMAAAIPKGKLEVVPGEGHLSLIVNHLPRCIEAILELG